MKKLFYILLSLTISFNITAMQNNSHQQTQRAVTNFQQRALDNLRLTVQTVQQRHQGQPRSEHVEDNSDTSSSRTLYPAAHQQHLYEQEGNESFSQTTGHQGNVSPSNIPRGTQNQESDDEIREIKFKSKKRSVLRTWGWLFGLANSSLIFYLGIKNITSKQGSTVKGLSEILLGSAGIVASSTYGARKFSSIFGSRSPE